MPHSQLHKTMTISQIFNIANLFVLPFWTLIILLPNWKVTHRIMASYLPFVVLAGVYLYLFINSITPENAQDFSNMELANVARLFANEKVAATGWVHYLVMDLFVGRWIYLEGQKTGVWTIHSLALCFFAGPLGLLSHIFTALISQKFFPKLHQNEAVTVAEQQVSSTNS